MGCVNVKSIAPNDIKNKLDIGKNSVIKNIYGTFDNTNIINEFDVLTDSSNHEKSCKKFFEHFNIVLVKSETDMETINKNVIHDNISINMNDISDCSVNNCDKLCETQCPAILKKHKIKLNTI